MAIQVTGPDSPERTAAALWGWVERPAWMARAACQGKQIELFFPVRGGSTAEAKQICSNCPVQGECRAYALEDDFTFGIWGGTSHKQRQAMRGRP